jgi:hypothetical protein
MILQVPREALEFAGMSINFRYRVAEPIWDKEDAERAEQGLPPRFEKYRDKQTRNYVRARYKIDPVTKELTTDPKTKALERVLVRNTPPRN